MNTFNLTQKDCKNIRKAITDNFGKMFGVTYEIQICESEDITKWTGDFVKVSEAYGWNIATLQTEIPHQLSIFISHYEDGLLDDCYVERQEDGTWLVKA